MTSLPLPKDALLISNIYDQDLVSVAPILAAPELACIVPHEKWSRVPMFCWSNTTWGEPPEDREGYTPGAGACLNAIGLTDKKIGWMKATRGFHVKEADPDNHKEAVLALPENDPVRLAIKTTTFGGQPSSDWVRNRMRAFFWAWYELLAQDQGVRRGFVIPAHNNDLIVLDKKIELGLAGIELAMPENFLVPLDEALDLRNQLFSQLQPYWRTIRRIGTSPHLMAAAAMAPEEMKIVCREIIDSEIGTTLESWTDHMNSELSNATKLGYLSRSKNWRNTMKFIVKALTGDIAGATDIIFDSQSASKMPSEMPSLDFDASVKLLYELRKTTLSFQ